MTIRIDAARPLENARGWARTGVRAASALILALVFGALVAVGSARAENIALVIGNGDYDGALALSHAVADARAVRARLEDERGFRVFYAENATSAAMTQAIGAFLAATAPGDLAMIYFAGYAAQRDPDDPDSLLLAPTNAPPPLDAADMPVFARDAAPLADIRAYLGRLGVRLRFFVLDARPITGLTRALGDDGARGLGRIEAAPDELILYATQPGRTALDRLTPDDSHPNSVFARVFLDAFQEGVSISKAASDTQLGVAALALSNGLLQEPYIDDRITGGCFETRCDDITEPAATPAPAIAPLDPTASGGADETAGAQLSVQELAISSTAEQGSAAESPAAVIAPIDAAAPLAGEMPSDEEEAAAEAAYRDAVERESRVALQLVAQIHPTTYWGQIAGLDLEEARVRDEAERALAEIDERRSALDWRRLRLTRDMDELDDFIAAHGDGPLAADALAAKEALENDFRSGQVELRRLRYYWSAIDGDWGRGSQGAMRRFQEDIGVEPDGVLSKPMLALLKAEPDPAPDVRTTPPSGGGGVGQTAAAALAPRPSGTFRYRVEFIVDQRNGPTVRCVTSVVHDARSLRIGRTPVENCNTVQAFELNVAEDGLLREGGVFTGGGANRIGLRGKRWSFIGAGFGGGEIKTVKVVVRRQVN